MGVERAHEEERDHNGRDIDREAEREWEGRGGVKDVEQDVVWHVCEDRKAGEIVP